MFDPIVFWRTFYREWYRAQIMAHVSRTVDVNTLLQYRGDGIQTIPDFPGC